jgi:hypothetical protein
MGGEFAPHLERNVRHHVWKETFVPSRGPIYFIASSNFVMVQDAQ